MMPFILIFLTTLSFANPAEIMNSITRQQESKKNCLIVYNVQDQEKPDLFKRLESNQYTYFSEEGNLLITWGDKEKGQLQKLRDNKIILDKILDKGFDPNNVHPKFIEQLNLLKELTTKCK